MSSRCDREEKNTSQSHNAISVLEKDAPLRILIADDNKMSRLLVFNLLQNMEYCPEVVGNGREAVHRWEDDDFDLILMDINMPLMDGIEATWTIRNLEKVRGDYTPIIAQSADTSKADPTVFSGLGFDGFVGKPIILETLLEEIERSIQLKQLRPA